MDTILPAEYQPVDFNSLKQALAVHVPADLAKKLRVNQSPAFPPELAKGITVRQVDSLQRIFDIADEDKFGEWWRVYSAINLAHSKENEIRSGEDRARALRHAVHNGEVGSKGLPEVFFLIAQSSLLIMRIKKEFAEQKGGLWATLNNRTQKNGALLIAKIDELSTILDMMDVDLEWGTALNLPVVSTWCKEHDFREKLCGLRAVVEEDRAEGQQAFEGIYQRVTEELPSKKLDDTPPSIYRAFDRVARIIADTKGRKTRAKKEAIGLFEQWGIQIDEAAEKRAVQRARKKRHGGM
jgi:hypothetical protein